MTPEEIEAHKERLRARLEKMQRDPVYMRQENASMARTATRRIRQGIDSLERLQSRVTAICVRPESEPHTKWNATNFLEQTEALLAEDASPLPPPRGLNKEQAAEILEAYQSGDQSRITIVRRKYLRDMGPKE